MLINLIEKILLNSKYEKIEFEHQHENIETKLFKANASSKKSEHYLLLECNNPISDHADQLLLEWSDSLHLKARENLILDRSFGKNCTMIICWPETAITKKQIFQLEEDRYNFKKNVIPYSQNELTDLEKKDANLTIEKLNLYINESEGAFFQQFKKKSSELKNYYSLLLKIFIKLPFATYIHDTERLSDLDSSLTSDLSDDEISLYEFAISVDAIDDDLLMSEFLKRKT